MLGAAQNVWTVLKQTLKKIPFASSSFFSFFFKHHFWLPSAGPEMRPIKPGGYPSGALQKPDPKPKSKAKSEPKAKAKAKARAKGPTAFPSHTPSVVVWLRKGLRPEMS